MTAISKSPLRTFPLYYKLILTDINNFKDFSKYSNPNFFLIFEDIYPFFCTVTRTSSDGMMIIMIRHVYIHLRLAGPEDPPHAAIMCQKPMADRVKIKNKSGTQK